MPRARAIQSPSLSTPTARLRLPVRGKSYSLPISTGIQLLFRRNLGAGAWSVKTKNWIKKLAAADDFEAANGNSVLDFDQAMTKARELARVGEGNSARLITVAEAIADYKADCIARGAQVTNATQIQFNMEDSPSLLSKPVALLKSKELSDWRNRLVAGGLRPSSADRIGRSLKAALNLAQRNDKRIVNGAEWKDALSRLKNANTARDNVILSDAEVTALVRACHDENDQLGIWIDILAETGARESQCEKLKVRDLQDGNKSPRLMLPTSLKGKNREAGFKPVPISARLAALLRKNATGPRAHDLLLTKVYKLSVQFSPVAARLGHGPEISPYSLRHSSIVRQLLKGTPIRVVASHHDTSVGEIERVYSRHISDVSDDLTRATLLDFGGESAGNVVPLRK